MTASRWFAGVCLAAGGKKAVLAVMDSTMIPHCEKLAEGDLEGRLLAYPEITVAISGPLQKGRANAPSNRLAFGRPRLAMTRMADAELTRRGIPVRIMPSVEGVAPSWMRLGFKLARRLREAAFLEGPGNRDAERWLVETHAIGSFAALLKKLPLPRETLEGRLQRQLVLFRERLMVADPMDVLEEVTAHHLLAGDLHLEGLLAPEELEACAAAYTAWAATLRPERVSWVGGEDDSWICLPADPLEAKYASGSPRTSRRP
jgi:hypothetical protein